MSIEIKVPTLPESVADATVVTWHKKVGEAVSRDELLVEIETDKVVLEVPAPAEGVLEKIISDEGVLVTASDILGVVAEGAVAAAPAAIEASSSEASADKSGASTSQDTSAQSPAVRKLLAEHNLDASQISGTGKGGRLLKEDILSFLEHKPVAAPAPTANT